METNNYMRGDESEGKSMIPEELKSDEPQVPAEEIPSEATAAGQGADGEAGSRRRRIAARPTFGEPEQPAPAGMKRFSATQWVIGFVVVVALLGYPLLHRALDSGDSSASAGASTAPNAAAQTMLNQSFSLYQAHKYEEAIAVGKILVRDNPKFADGWNNLAAAYVALGRWDEAIESAKAALVLVPDHQMAKGNLALAQKSKASGAPPPGQGPAAGTTQFFLNLSADDYRTGKFPECIDDAGKAIAMDPKSSEAYNNRGACYGSLGMFDEEIASEQQSVRLNPGNQLAKNNLDWALQRKKIRDSVREKK